jgi:CubicO group peptidase (beta-lactamase class C family)
MLMKRRTASVALLVAAVNLGGLTAAAPADAWMRVTKQITQPVVKRVTQPVVQKVQPVVQKVKPVVQTVKPVVETGSRAVSYVAPGVPQPAAPPTGSLGASPMQIAFGNSTTIGTPEYWSDKWQRLINEDKSRFTLPWPADLLKPELILPSEAIPNGPEVAPLPRAPKDLSGLRYTHLGQTRSIADYMRTTETDAIVFVQNGALVAEAYANGYSPTQQHQPWSVTKSFVSSLVGIAQDEGRIGSLDDPIEKYIPDLRNTAWAGTTVRNIIEMEAGIEWNEATPVVTENSALVQWAHLWLDYVSNGKAGMDRNEFLASLKRIHPQGTKWHYSSGNTQVLAWMLEQVYGKSFAKIASEKIWKPAGMQAPAAMATDRHGNALASQGLYSIPYDLTRFGQLMLNRGRAWNGRQLVSERWVSESTDMNRPSGVDGGYGYHWGVNHVDNTGFQGYGFQGNFLAISPSRCIVSLRMAHTVGITVGVKNGFDFALDMGAPEWNDLRRAVYPALGGCA